MIRAFLAVELGEPLRQRLAKIQQELKTHIGRRASTDVRISWTASASIHLTVKFLGDIAESLVEPLGHEIGQAVGAYAPMTIPLDRLGAFPHLQQPSLLWVGPPHLWASSRDAVQLAELHRAVDASCKAVGIASDERPFSPHLTIARIKGGRRTVGEILAVQSLTSCALGALSVESIVLMQSELRPSGSVYTKLRSCPLARIERVEDGKT